MELNNLTDENYHRQSKKRVGRGIGCGKGKTCGSGHKGQKSRSGVSINGFEGGQMPLYQRLPKRGFVNILRKDIEIVNLRNILQFIESKKIDASKVINKDILVKVGLIKKNKPVKILAQGELKSKLDIKVDFASKKAVELIKKAGGNIEVGA